MRDYVMAQGGDRPITVTFFKNKFATEQRREEMTLEQLADLIRNESAPKKVRLPWLKLARFGDVANAKKCLRYNANVESLSGVEVEHDAGLTTFSAAIEAMRKASICCIGYTSPSYIPAEKEKWRILLPSSKPISPDMHASLVARANGVLAGAASDESYVLSQAYLYGRVGDNPAHAVEVVDGDFLDQRDDLDANAVHKPKREKTALGTPTRGNGAAPGRDEAEIEALLKRSQTEGQWHNSMRDAVASMIGKGWSDKAIFDATAPYCRDGWGDSDITTFIVGGRAKWRAPDPGTSTRQLGETMRATLNWRAPSKMQEVDGIAPRPKDDAPLAEKAHWLLQTHGYHAASHTVVELYEASDVCQLRPQAFQFQFRSWREMYLGPRGGENFDIATARWEVNATRLNIKGIQMRPDRPFPVFEEDGAYYKNTYRRPQHEGRGDIQPWLDFMWHLLPDEREREWFCNWLAHKHVNPSVPGVAVVMVAADANGPVYGAGRGMLRDILARLLGKKYVRPIDFDIFAGRSSQAVYTDWQAYALLVTVNEARDDPNAGRWSDRRATYERLKELVDPRPTERTFTRKGQPAFEALAFASYLIASNNRDALQIPDGDRRVAALANGKKMPAEMAQKLQAWMEDERNIAELARWLEARDLSRFDAYEPLATTTKATMQELARSDFDDAFAVARKLIGENGLFTHEQIQAAMDMELGGNAMFSHDHGRALRRKVRAEATAVAEFRTPREQGRKRILHWRGSNSPWMADAAHAQAAVDQTAKRLKQAYQARGLAGQILAFTVGGGDGDGG
jgi:hypothetical protein